MTHIAYTMCVITLIYPADMTPHSLLPFIFSVSSIIHFIFRKESLQSISRTVNVIDMTANISQS